MLARAKPTARLATSLLAAALLLAACQDERPPAPPAAAQGPAGPGPATAQEATARYDPSMTAVLTHAGERGSFVDTKDPASVPAGARGMVRVVLLDGPHAPPGTVWVANLDKPEPDGSYVLHTVPRELFEELALGQGLSSKVTLPEGLEAPDVAPSTGEIVVYKTSWCGVCKKLEQYLKRKGVTYVAKDIEKDPKAAAGLRAKAKKAGVATGSVPIIDVGGELLVGFDRRRLEQLLPA